MSHLNFIHTPPLAAVSLFFAKGAGAIFSHMVYLTDSINKALALKYTASYLLPLNTLHSFYASDVVACVKAPEQFIFHKREIHE
jgi:uncharacterized membrane protein